MKKIYSILFCLMAMSITFSSCSKSELDEMETNSIELLNKAYNSGDAVAIINALKLNGFIAKPQSTTRSGDSDDKYVLTKEGKDYFKSDLFEVAKNEKNAYSFLCFVFQGIYSVDHVIQEDMYEKYRWVSLDDTNVWFECSHKGDNYNEEFVITWHKDGEVLVFNFKDNRQIVNFDKIELSIREDLAYDNYIRKVSNDDPFIFSQVRGNDDFYSSGGYYYTSSKNNICIVNISTEHKYDIVQGLYIRVPKTNN